MCVCVCVRASVMRVWGVRARACECECVLVLCVLESMTLNVYIHNVHWVCRYPWPSKVGTDLIKSLMCYYL